MSNKTPTSFTSQSPPKDPLAATPGNEPFVNPYADIEETPAKLACLITTSDYNYVKCIRPGHGTNTGVIGTLWKKLVNELNKRNIHSVADIDEFERFVANCRIVSYEEGRVLDVLEEQKGVERVNGGSAPVAERSRRFPNSPTNGNLSNSTSPSLQRRTQESSPTSPPTTVVSSDLQKRDRTKGRRSSKGEESKGSVEKSNE